jgi:AcrR family transcriptional regulator
MVRRMSRIRPPNRLGQLMDAAIDVFISKGYRRTQMADVARAAGVSQGTLYNYVESKEALFYLIIDRGLIGAAPPILSEQKVRTPAPGETIARLRHRINTELRVPELERALARSSVADPSAELKAIINQYYAVVARLGRGLDLIERSAVDLPELGQLLYVERRRSIVAQLTRYLESRIASGAFRPLPHPATAARLILETVVWFSRHRHRTPDSAMITDQAALETTVDFLVGGLIAPTGQRKLRTRRAKKTIGVRGPHRSARSR